MNPDPRIFYFGCMMGSKGHFLHDSHGQTYWANYRKINNFPWIIDQLDTGFCPAEGNGEGHGRFQQLDGWSILAIWDSSGDERPGSHSTYLVDTLLACGQLERLAKEKFPQFWKRMTDKYSILHFSHIGETVSERRQRMKRP